jgi:hypothetical protein
MCIGLGITILISKSETSIPISSLLNPDNNVEQKSELTTKPATREDRTVVDVGYANA